MEKTAHIMQPVRPAAAEGPCRKLRNAGKQGDFKAELCRQVGTQKDEPMRSFQSWAPSAADRGRVRLGAISKENPTVSHLLISNPEYGGDCWKIIHSAVNAHKDFCSLQEGENIFVDPATQEILWGEQTGPVLTGASPDRDVAPRPPDDPVPKHEPSINPTESKGPPVAGRTGRGKNSLATVLKPYIGTPYKSLNCYELVVAGLGNMGVQYGGRGGLQTHLIRAAAGAGLPANAYLTGNGLIDAASTTVFDQTLTDVEGALSRTDQLWKDLAPRLEEGLLVSFTTGRKGHTGVISRYGDQWTFLNSGVIDHDVRSDGRKKGVAEEDLKSEIANWLRRAKHQGTPLRVTLGRLDSEKLAVFMRGASHRRTA